MWQYCYVNAAIEAARTIGHRLLQLYYEDWELPYEYEMIVWNLLILRR